MALSRRGLIWIVRWRDRQLRALTRGASPVWSPDGSMLAYIGRHGFPYVIAVRGGRSRLVSRVAVRSVDWQPLPRSRSDACTAPAGSTLVAQDAQAVIVSHSHPTTPYG